jgi:hypothetical protein
MAATTEKIEALLAKTLVAGAAPSSKTTKMENH